MGEQIEEDLDRSQIVEDSQMATITEVQETDQDSQGDDHNTSIHLVTNIAEERKSSHKKAKEEHLNMQVA
jgi:hypothetical protein